LKKSDWFLFNCYVEFQNITSDTEEDKYMQGWGLAGKQNEKYPLEGLDVEGTIKMINNNNKYILQKRYKGFGLDSSGSG
jgi:hypothetical protein